MSDLQTDILRILRVFGPCSNAEIARRLGEPLHRTYRGLQELVSSGLAVHPLLHRWDVTTAGREVFARKLAKQLSLFMGD